MSDQKTYVYGQQNAGQNNGQNAGQNASQNVGRNISQNAGQNTSQNAGQNTSQNAGRNTSQNISPNISRNICQNIGRDTASGRANGYSAHTSSRPKPEPSRGLYDPTRRHSSNPAERLSNSAGQLSDPTRRTSERQHRPSDPTRRTAEGQHRPSDQTRRTAERQHRPSDMTRQSAERQRRPTNPEGEGRPYDPQRRPSDARRNGSGKLKLTKEERELRRKKKRIKKIKKALKGFGIVSLFLALLVILIVLASKGLAKAMKGLMIEAEPVQEEKVSKFEEAIESLTEAPTEEATEYPVFTEPENYSAQAMREKGVPEVLIEFYEKYPEVAPYAWFYPEKSQINYDMDISKDVKKGTIPYFCQWDDRWGYKEYGNSYFGVAGCGPTCISMIYSGLTGKTDKNPYQIGMELAEREYYIPGSGTVWDAMTDIPQEYDLEVIDVPCYEEDIRNTLKEGHPIICNVIPGDFTQIGHYIILTGIDDDDQLTICDPNSPERSSQKWDLERVIVQIDALWGYAYYGE